MSAAAVQSQLPRNISIAKAESSTDDQPRTLPWPSSQTSATSSIGLSAQDITSRPNDSTRTAPSGISSPARVNGMISKDDLINSNPFAAASVSNGSVEGRHSMGSDNESEGCSRTYDESKTGTDGKKQARRRKANRACSHCQKAHLTCDDSRPCERCVKKGLSDTCTDGARKKAKYLLDEDEILELKLEKGRNKSEVQVSAEPFKQVVKTEPGEHSDRLASTSQWDASKLNHGFGSPSSHLVTFDPTTTIAPSSLTGAHNSTGTSSAHQNSDTDIYGTLSTFSPTSSSGLNVFGSEATSLEYSILSSMLNGIDPAWLSGSPEGQGQDTDMDRVINANSASQSAFSHMGINGMPWQMTTEEASPWRDSRNQKSKPTQVEPLHHMDPTISGSAHPADTLAAFDALEVPSPHGTMAGGGFDEAVMTAQSKGAAKANAKLAQTMQNSKRAALAAAAATGKDKKPDAEWQEKVSHIYSDKMKPFPYTEGYHFLIKHITANLEKADVLRIVRALAIFRPSLIALQMPLTEEDEVFVERCIQRTILEFGKLISFSGTPTVVWRRTCEMVVVGAEFSMLTQWSKDYLTGRYIYEFLDKASIVEYWEKFALHAFENTAQSIMMQVTLKTSTGKSVKCAACFSIKRDVFDLPSLIVGNFLPILS